MLLSHFVVTNQEWSIACLCQRSWK